jgi:hypothetical protein
MAQSGWLCSKLLPEYNIAHMERKSSSPPTEVLTAQRVSRLRKVLHFIFDGFAQGGETLASVHFANPRFYNTDKLAKQEEDDLNANQ